MSHNLVLILLLRAVQLHIPSVSGQAARRQAGPEATHSLSVTKSKLAYGFQSFFRLFDDYEKF